jgi:hypothetical protein
MLDEIKTAVAQRKSTITYVKLVCLMAIFSTIATTLFHEIFSATAFPQATIDVTVPIIPEAPGEAVTVPIIPSAKQPKETPGEDVHVDDRCFMTRNKYRKRTEGRITSTGYLGSKLELLLEGPPYYIVQHGESRSGSTFQFHLLQAIVDLKSKDSPGLPMVFRNSPKPGHLQELRKKKDVVYQGEIFLQEMVDYGFIQKSHSSAWVEKTICELQKLGKQVVVFVSVTGSTPSKTKDENDRLRTILAPITINYDTGYVAHVQVLNEAEFKNCSSCQIETYYKTLFDLSGKEIEILLDYTEKYSILRRCCGRQMSKYNRLRLHGCDISKYQNKKDRHEYPWCENHDLPEIELSFAKILEDHGLRPPEKSSGWTKPGDCAESEVSIRGGDEFRGRWNGKCTLDSMDLVRKRTQFSIPVKKKRKKRGIKRRR